MSTFIVNELIKILRLLFKNQGIYISPHFFDMRNNVMNISLNVFPSSEVSVEKVVTLLKQEFKIFLDRDWGFYINPFYQQSLEEIFIFYAESKEDYDKFIVNYISGKVFVELFNKYGEHIYANTEREFIERKRAEILTEMLKRYDLFEYEGRVMIDLNRFD